MTYDPNRRIWDVDTQVIRAKNRAELDAAINATLTRFGINPFSGEPMWEPMSVTHVRRNVFWVTFRRLVPELPGYLRK